MLDRNSDEWRALFARMSGHYLTAHLPDDWGKWPDDVLENFFEDHVWEPLEHWSVDDVFDQIACLTDDVARLLAEPKGANKEEAFWEWIDQCPKGIYVNHDFTDDEDHQKIHVFGFAVPKETEDE